MDLMRQADREADQPVAGVTEMARDKKGSLPTGRRATVRVKTARDAPFPRSAGCSAS